MIDNHFHTERKYGGKPIVIDIAEILGKYEVMTMYANGKDIESVTVDNLDDAVVAYTDMLYRYPESDALKGKYAKLRDDLKIALAAAKAADIGEDGGTCNFDAPSLYLPRWIESKVKQAAEEAGTSCFKWELYGGARYVFNPKSSGQGNRRCRASEAMEHALQTAGYDCLMYCQMD